MTFKLKLCSSNGICAEKDFIVHVDNSNEAPFFDTGGSLYGDKDMLRILIKVTKEDQINNFIDPTFQYKSPKVVDPEGDKIIMKFQETDGLKKVGCFRKDCIKFVKANDNSDFTIQAQKPELKKEDQGRYVTYLTLQDDNIYSGYRNITVIVDIIYDELYDSGANNSSCYARIVSIDEFGHTLIKFNRDMRPIPNNNMTNLN